MFALKEKVCKNPKAFVIPLGDGVCLINDSSANFHTMDIDAYAQAKDGAWDGGVEENSDRQVLGLTMDEVPYFRY